MNPAVNISLLVAALALAAWMRIRAERRRAELQELIFGPARRRGLEEVVSGGVGDSAVTGSACVPGDPGRTDHPRAERRLPVRPPAGVYDQERDEQAVARLLHDAAREARR